MKTRLYLVLALLLALTSCGNFQENKLGESERTSIPGKVDFAIVRTAIFQPACVACHQQYDNYGGIKRDLDRITASVNADRMPKSGGPLSASLKALLAAWVAAGAPEAMGEAPGELPPVSLEPNWNSVSQNIIGPKCAVCHNPNGQAKFLNLSTRQAIWDARNGFQPGSEKLLDLEHPEQSYLFQVVQDPTGPMPPVSSGLGPLSREEINVLIEWVGLGLP